MWEVRGSMPEAIEPVWNWSVRQNSGTVGTYKGKPRSTIARVMNLYSFITQLSVNVAASLTENMLHLYAWRYKIWKVLFQGQCKNTTKC